MSKILIVEDEKQLSDIIADWLINEHHVIEQSFDGDDAWNRLSAAASYDLIILDLMLPNVSGMDICRRFRNAGGITPILMLTAKRALSSKESGLDAGADDYMTKPFKLRELSARVRALLRRPAALLPNTITAGDISLDLLTRRATKAGEDIHLLPKEFALLGFLMKHKNDTVTVDCLIENIWNQETDISPDTIRSHIRSLRKKLGDSEEIGRIQNIHGIGYRLRD